MPYRRWEIAVVGQCNSNILDKACDGFCTSSNCNPICLLISAYRPALLICQAGRSGKPNGYRNKALPSTLAARNGSMNLKKASKYGGSDFF